MFEVKMLSNLVHSFRKIAAPCLQGSFFVVIPPHLRIQLGYSMLSNQMYLVAVAESSPSSHSVGGILDTHRQRFGVSRRLLEHHQYRHSYRQCSKGS